MGNSEDTTARKLVPWSCGVLGLCEILVDISGAYVGCGLPKSTVCRAGHTYL